MVNVLAILLAGGAGERLHPLTRDTAKPGVPFGGVYRIIDFTLSNCMNSDVRRIFILTQYKSLELNRHIRDGWHIFSSEMGEFVEILPPMKRVSDDWYQGTADAVYQNLQSILTEAPDAGADPLRRPHLQDELPGHAGLAPSQGGRYHDRDYPDRSRRGAPLRHCADRPATTASPASKKNRSTAIRCVRASIRRRCSASMGIYIFNTQVLIDELLADAADPNSSHDFGKDCCRSASHGGALSPGTFSI